MSNDIKDEGLTCAYLLGKHDGINQKITEVLDELLKQVRKEEKWLFKVMGSNQNINIAFGGIYAKAEQLKEQTNE